jgi:formylglycine-generating enzyme required for sulfatase activity
MKTVLHSLFIGLAFMAGLDQTTAQVTNLGIAPVAGGQSLLYWPAGPTNYNYILQSTTNLVSPNWTTEEYPVPVTASTVSNTAPAKFFRLVYTNPPVGMVLIPAGSFTMGNQLVNPSNNTPTNDPDITDALPTNVYVSAFFMDANLVDLSVWQAVYTYAVTFNGYSFDDAGAGKAANQPVQTVNWYDCVKWCNARSQEAGLTPVYYTDAGFTQVYKSGDVDAVYVNWGASGFRLPTEAEWEKAARGGLNGRRFPWGNLISEGQANYSGNTNGYSYDLGPNGYNSIGSIGGTSPATSPVGSFDVNGYGLYDMSGNVFEWCWDWYAAPPYPAGSPYLGGTNPTGAGPTSGYRVLRGGYWNGDASVARCAFRNYNSPNLLLTALFGFRCVRGL